MGLLLRRARTARSLLLAASGATVVCTVLLTGITVHSVQVLDDGARNAVASAPRTERSVLLRGSLDRGTYADRDAAVRSRTTPDLGGAPTDVRAAGYATGRQLTGDTGTAVPDAEGRVYASVVFLEALDQHADLTSGNWPQAGATPAQTALGAASAATLGARVGDRIPITDRLTSTVSDVVVSGIWRPRDLTDPYWQLAPDAGDGVAARSSTYGPLVLHRTDFLDRWSATASAAWVVRPDLGGASAERLDAVAAATATAVDELPTATGLGSSATATSDIGALVQRLHSADLVGRSTLVTPVLLLIVLGGYTLLLVALLLGEQRSAETALLRARGAGRGQLGALAAREAALIVTPAVLLAPWLATLAVRGTPWPGGWAWGAALLAGLACGLAVLLPALRTGGTYVAAMAGQSRPGRRAAAQRAGLDVALVAAAVLGWLQLRQYSSPVAGSTSGGLRLDPLLAAAPTLGVLAGAAVGLRVLPLLTRTAQRRADRRAWVAGTFGMWQAGRRAHAGAVLMLALAVAVSTLAWCLTATLQRSVADQADQAVGADLRITAGLGTVADTAAVAALPGVRVALPAVREELQIGVGNVPATMVALDAARAGDVVRVREDLADGGSGAVLDGLAAGRAATGAVPLPAGELTGSLRVDTDFGPVTGTAILASGTGEYRRVPLGEVAAGRPTPFAVPAPAGAGWSLAGFTLGTVDLPPGYPLTWRLTGLKAGGVPVDLGTAAQWRSRDVAGDGRQPEVGGDSLAVTYTAPRSDSAGGVVTTVVGRIPAAVRVPVVATDAALAALTLRVGDDARMRLGADDVDVRITGSLRAVPGTTGPAALLVDLPSLSTALFDRYGRVAETDEWWLSADPRAATAAAALSGVDVVGREQQVAAAARDPYGRGARDALFAAALGAVLLAGLGLTVDVRATARRRAGELAVLHTLGAGPRLLAASLVAEQAVLAAVGIGVGVLAGIGVAATLAPLVILTPAAARPVPEPLLVVPWWPIAAGVAVLVLLTLALSAVTALTLRRRLTATRLRLGVPG